VNGTARFGDPGRELFQGGLPGVLEALTKVRIQAGGANLDFRKRRPRSPFVSFYLDGSSASNSQTDLRTRCAAVRPARLRISAPNFRKRCFSCLGCTRKKPAARLVKIHKIDRILDRCGRALAHSRDGPGSLLMTASPGVAVPTSSGGPSLAPAAPLFLIVILFERVQ
jgi:hypothetical protein